MSELNVMYLMGHLQRFYNPKCDDPTVPQFDQMDYFICVTGENDGSGMTKQKAFMIWLLKLASKDIVTILGKKIVYFLCDSERLSYLKSILNKTVLTMMAGNNLNLEVQFEEINAANENNETVFKKVIDSMKSNMEHGKIGVLGSEDSQSSSFEKVWYKCLNEANFIKEDMSGFVAYLMSIKDEREIELMKESCKLLTNVYAATVLLIEKMNKSKKLRKKLVTNRNVATRIKRKTLNGAYNPREYVPVPIDFWYSPIIQSGGHYDFTLHSGSKKDKLESDVVLMSYGIRSHHLCSSITRICMPHHNNWIFSNNYQLLVKVQKFIINNLRDGVKLNKVYKDAVDHVKKLNPYLSEKLSDNFGSAIGIQGEENFYEINENNEALVKENMTFNVKVGFISIPDTSKAVIQNPPHLYSLWVGDIVKVEKGRRATVLCDVPFRRRSVQREAIYRFLRRSRGHDIPPHPLPL